MIYRDERRPIDVLADANPEFADSMRRLMLRGDAMSANAARIVMQEVRRLRQRLPDHLVGDTPNRLAASPIDFYTTGDGSHRCGRCLPYTPGSVRFLANGDRAELCSDLLTLEAAGAECARCGRRPMQQESQR